MIIFMDQIISWAIIIICLWIIHQTGGSLMTIANFLMRFGIAGFALTLATDEVLHFKYMPTFWTSPTFKFFLLLMFIGIVLFHHKRFSKL